MFRRITNIDLLNKIVEIENKIDILDLKQSSLIDDYFTKLNDKIDKINENHKDIVYEKINEIYNKIDMLYYENETIKHQLLLEEDIRKYECEINTLANIINKTILDIDKILIGSI
jgi:hypothetical protein